MWIDQRGSEVLTVPECHRLLAVGAVAGLTGRLGVASPGGQAPVVVPVLFTVHEHEVIVAIGPGSLAQSAIGHLVAFEIDHIDEEASIAWSVLVRGLAVALGPEDAPRGLVIPKPRLPNPGRIVLAVRSDIVTGRRFILT
jgi:nitroimidazol reductase NimA-like FMN-containing flavoprotein (pyridoxamine 5'-phosphate oxidase superfamily)